MKPSVSKYLLYAVTDRSWLSGDSLEKQVEEILVAGVTMLQLREKEILHTEFVEIAKNIKAISDRLHVPLIINDDIETAIIADADGIHIGQDDIPAEIARKMIGMDKVLGISVQTVEQALLAQSQGADYLGVGAVFPTQTKTDADFVPYKTLKAICNAVTLPVVAIGGIHENNIPQLNGSGIAGIAVVSAIFAKPDKTQAVRQLLKCAREVIQYDS